MSALPMRAGTLSIAELIDLYMAHYTGRDTTRVQRLEWWRVKIGRIVFQDLTDDHVHAALEELAQQHSRYFAGNDVDGKPVYKAKRKPLAPATINRYAASLAAVITWAIKKRIAPKGYAHPCRSVERRAENNEKTRYLSADERQRLLEACKASPWPKLYLIVLMALTTGARKGELLGLSNADIDYEHGVAHVGRSKNGDPKTLPLTTRDLRDHGLPCRQTLRDRMGGWAECLKVVGFDHADHGRALAERARQRRANTAAFGLAIAERLREAGLLVTFSGRYNVLSFEAYQLRPRLLWPVLGERGRVWPIHIDRDCRAADFDLLVRMDDLYVAKDFFVVPSRDLSARFPSRLSDPTPTQLEAFCHRSPQQLVDRLAALSRRAAEVCRS